MALHKGARLGRFELLDLLGRGGMGEVWRARDPRLSREVAVKVLPEKLAGDPEWGARFEREARALAALSHANVAQIYEVGEESPSSPGLDRPLSAPLRFLVMELVEGETLRDRLKREPLAPREALGVTLQVSRALVAAHSRGVIHRDLKPANIMLTGDGVAKVLDFGLARMQPPPDSASAADHTDLTLALSRPGTVLGTASYMAPEQMRGEECDERCDVWALGCCLAEMLTGRRVFAGGTVPEIVKQVLAGSADPSKLGSSAPRGIRDLVRACLRDDAEKRPTMGQVASRLEALHRASDRRVGGRWWRAAGWLAAAVLVLGAGWIVVERQLAGRPGPPFPPAPLRVALDPASAASGPFGAEVEAGLLADLAARPGVEPARGNASLEVRWDSEPLAQGRLLRVVIVDSGAGTVVSLIERELTDARSLDAALRAVGDEVEREGAVRELVAADPLHGFLARRTRSLPAVRAFQQGMSMYGRRRLADARASLEEARAADPGFWPATVYLAIVDASTSRFADGRAKLAAVRETLPVPDAAEETVIEVVEALLEDDSQRLSEALERARQRFPGSGELDYRTAWTYRQLDRPEDAIPLLERLIEVDWQPDWSPTLLQLAYCQLLVGDVSAALGTAGDGEVRFPQSYNFSYVAALAHHLRGEGEAAREALDRAIRKRIDFSATDRLTIHQWGAYWCGQIAWEEERRRQLELWLQEADSRLASTPGDDALIQQRAEALVGLGAFGEARELLAGLALRGGDPYVVLALARAELGLGDPDAARRLLERAGDAWRDGDLAARGVLAYNVACGWAAAGDAESAVRWLERARDLHGFDRLDLAFDPDLAPLRGTGLLDRFSANR